MILRLPAGGTLVAEAKSIVWTEGELVYRAELGFNLSLAGIEHEGDAVLRIPQRLMTVFEADALFGIVVLLVLMFAAVGEVLGFHFVNIAFWAPFHRSGLFWMLVLMGFVTTMLVPELFRNFVEPELGCISVTAPPIDRARRSNLNSE